MRDQTLQPRREQGNTEPRGPTHVSEIVSEIMRDIERARSELKPSPTVDRVDRREGRIQVFMWPS